MAAPDVGQRERREVRAVLDSGQLAAGPVVEHFEGEFAGFCGSDHAVATANGTAALHAALAALGVGDGDAVVTTPLSFVATANAVRLVGAEPVFADVDPETLTLDPAAVADVLDERDDVAAVLPVHLYGLPADVDELQAIADEHDVPVVEDACQAHGAAVDGDRVPAADVGCFSFYPTKNMTTGEGGAVVTDSDELAARVRSFVDHGRTVGDDSATGSGSAGVGDSASDAGSATDATSADGDHVRVGHNFRATDLAAAIGRAQLAKLEDYTEARRATAERYTERLLEAGATQSDDTVAEETTPSKATDAGELRSLSPDEVVVPAEPADRTHVFHQYTVRCGDREALREHLRRAGVDTAVYYPRPIHHEPAYADVAASTPVAERASETVCSVPVHPSLSERDRTTVADALADFVRQR